MTDYPEVNTIAATAARCKAERLGVCDKQLRRWVADGVLPSIPNGSRRLIRWSTLQEFLAKGTPIENASAASSRYPWRRR